MISWNGINQSNYDYFKIRVNGALVDHTSLNINNAGNPLLIAAGGIGRRNQFSTSLVDAGWKRTTLNLNVYEGNPSFQVKFRGQVQ